MQVTACISLHVKKGRDGRNGNSCIMYVPNVQRIDTVPFALAEHASIASHINRTAFTGQL